MIWTNLGKFWTPRSLTQYCNHCRDNTKHDQRIVRRNDKDRRPAAQLEGFTQEASRNRIAPLLAQDWAKAMLAKKKQDWVQYLVVRHMPPSVGIETYDRVEKRSKIERDEKKRETGPKPLNINARNAWRCGDQGIRASGPRRNEIKRATGMARRIKENQHWAGVCAGMAMAQVYIEPITAGGAAVEGPANHREPFKFIGPRGAGWGAGGGRGAVTAKTKKKKPSKARKEEKKKKRDR